LRNSKNKAHYHVYIFNDKVIFAKYTLITLSLAENALYYCRFHYTETLKNEEHFETRFILRLEFPTLENFLLTRFVFDVRYSQILLEARRTGILLAF